MPETGAETAFAMVRSRAESGINYRRLLQKAACIKQKGDAKDGLPYRSSDSQDSRGKMALHHTTQHPLRTDAVEVPSLSYRHPVTATRRVEPTRPTTQTATPRLSFIAHRSSATKWPNHAKTPSMPSANATSCNRARSANQEPRTRNQEQPHRGPHSSLAP